MRALVTGAGGFIGSHLVERLCRLGIEVRAFVRYTSRPHLGFLKGALGAYRSSLEVVKGDLRDPDAIHRAMSGVDVALHLGALIGIPYSYVHPRETVETNVLGTFNILTAARAHDVPKVIVASSSEVYGTAVYVPIDERHPLHAQSPYAASKIGADSLAGSFAASYGLQLVIVRPFNTYGPRQSARAVIPTIITQALDSETVSLGNISPRRDYTYVTDTVEGFINAMRSERAVGHTINLGTSSEISIEELVAMVATLLEKPLKIVEDAERKRRTGSEVELLKSDNRLAAELLDWRPTVSLEDGLRRTIEWIGAHKLLYQEGLYEI